MAEGDVLVSISADASDLIREAKRAQKELVDVGEAGVKAGTGVKRGLGEAEKATRAAAAEAKRLAAEERRLSADLARQQVADAKRQTAAAQAQAQAITTSARQSKAGVVQLGNQLADIGSQLSTGTSPMTILIQQGPQVANALAVMGISLSSIIGVLGPVALAVGALVYAWSEYNDELKVAEARQEAAAKAATSLQEALAKSNRVVASAQDAAAVAMGDATEAQLKQRDAVKSIIAANEEEIASRRETIRSLENQIEASKKAEAAANTRGAIKAAQEEATTREGLTRQLDNQRNQLANLTTGQDRAITTTVNLLQAVTDAEAAARAAAEADREAAEAMRRRREEAQRLFDALQQDAKYEIERQDAITAAILSANDAATSSANARLGPEDKVRAALEEQLRLLRAQQAAILATNMSAVEEAGVKEAFLNAEVEATRTAQEEIDKIREDAAKKEEARQARVAKEQARLAGQVMSTVADGLSGLADIAGDAYAEQVGIIQMLEQDLLASEQYLTEAQIEAKREQIESARKAARKQFEVEKAASLAAAIVNTAEAVTQALASGPPPGNLILAGISGAAGAVQVGTIAAQQPSFHTGLAPDEYTAKLQKGEAVLSRQGIAAANDGVSRGMGDRPIVVEMRYGHKVFDRFVQRDLQRTGTLANALRNAARGRSS